MRSCDLFVLYVISLVIIWKQLFNIWLHATACQEQFLIVTLRICLKSNYDYQSQNHAVAYHITYHIVNSIRGVYVANQKTNKHKYKFIRCWYFVASHTSNNTLVYSIYISKNHRQLYCLSAQWHCRVNQYSQYKALHSITFFYIIIKRL